jgi:hypothetical protein
VCEETLDFLMREMMIQPNEAELKPWGGFYSSLDADSEGEEGKFYIWTLDELRSAIEAGQHTTGQEWPGFDPAAFFFVAYNVTEAGNFEGHNILQRASDDKSLAERFDIPVQAVPELLGELHRHLLSQRGQRVRPGLDDKVLTAWNGLALTAFAEAARYLERPDYLEIARQNAHFLLTELHPGKRLQRSWRNGQAGHNAYLEDYAALILGLLVLYQSDPETRWYSEAQRLAQDMLKHYRDESGGFYDTPDDHEALLVRPKDLQDNATPTGNALAALALLQLSALSGVGKWRDVAEQALGSIQDVVIRYPLVFAKWLGAIDLAIGPIFEVAILGDPEHAGFGALRQAVWQEYRPRCLAAFSAYPPAAEAPPLLFERPLLQGLPTAYVCQQFICQRPVTTAADLLAQIF